MGLGSMGQMAGDSVGSTSQEGGAEEGGAHSTLAVETTGNQSSIAHMARSCACCKVCASVCKNSKEMVVAQAVRWCCRRDVRMAICRAEDQALAEMWAQCHADMAAFADRGRIRGMEGEDVAQEEAPSCDDALDVERAALADGRKEACGVAAPCKPCKASGAPAPGEILARHRVRIAAAGSTLADPA